MTRNIGIILVLLITAVVCGITIYLVLDDDKVCDELVIMNDGSQIESTNVSSFENGMSTIRTCTGEQMDTPTINIKMVKHIKK
jgi:hypothetical protein